jgi:hypothetical protein
MTVAHKVSDKHLSLKVAVKVNCHDYSLTPAGPNSGCREVSFQQYILMIINLNQILSGSDPLHWTGVTQLKIECWPQI